MKKYSKSYDLLVHRLLNQVKTIYLLSGYSKPTKNADGAKE